MMRKPLMVGATAVLTGIAALAFASGDPGRATSGVVVVRSATAAAPSMAARPALRPDAARRSRRRAAAAHDRIGFLVPAYFYPVDNGDWDRMAAAVARTSPVTAIMNPASGPGSAEGPYVADYQRETGELRAAGGKVLGYVPTGFVGTRTYPGCGPSPTANATPAYVVKCALEYGKTYAVDGVFLDQMSVDPQRPRTQQQQIRFYTEVYDGIKRDRPEWIVFGNPGTQAPEGLLRKGRGGGADTLVTFEDYARDFGGSTPAPYAAGYASRRFGALLHTAPPRFSVPAALARAREKTYGYFYATDDVYAPPPDERNPYDRLPTDWERQVRQLRAFNRD